MAQPQTEGDSIVWAIKNGDFDQVKELIEQKQFNVNEEIAARFPIHFAADYGQTDVLRYLITKGANVNVSVGVLLNIFTFHSRQVSVTIAPNAANVIVF